MLLHDYNATAYSMAVQADSGIRASPPSQDNQKFDFGAFLKGDLPKKLLIMLVDTAFVSACTSYCLCWGDAASNTLLHHQTFVSCV